jgi:phenylalanyl-tRNA synthetase alpha chain
MSEQHSWFNLALIEISDCSTVNQLEQCKATYLGKSSFLSKELSSMSKLSKEEKKIKGPLLNNQKKILTEKFKLKRDSLSFSNAKTKNLDPTLPLCNSAFGSLHPISQAFIKAISFFERKNFIIADGPEIETEDYNFTKLNLDENHPARDEADTFYFSEDLLLRTHTSSVQIRSMMKHKPPMRIISPGRVYRKDSDPTHTPMFHQLEGFLISENANLSNLKSTLKEFLSYFFESDVEMRLRPSFFPFTEPSIEIDIQCMNCNNGCSLCKNTTWLEVLGCGMINSKVLENVGVDSENYKGWAFGIGIDRLVMIKHKVPDLRLMFTGNIDFLKQFDKADEIF